MRTCLLAATTAPSVFNTQPWLFWAGHDRVEAFVDRGRQLHGMDHQGREMFVSVGAAVFNLRLALWVRGWVSDVEVTPDPADPDLAARLTLSGSGPVPAAVEALASAIPRRRTNRRPFADRAVPDQVLAELSAAAAAEGAHLLVADPALQQGVISLTRTAERRLRDDPGYERDLRHWTTPGGPGRRDGVPRQALGPHDSNDALPLRDFAHGLGLPSSTVPFERHPTIALLLTAGDRPADWVHAGQALQRVLLTATVRGLATTPLSQLAEVPQLRDLLTEEPNGRVVQTVLRVGYALYPAAPTPRRNLADVIRNAPA
jgi:nitroreductase